LIRWGCKTVAAHDLLLRGLRRLQELEAPTVQTRRGWGNLTGVVFRPGLQVGSSQISLTRSFACAPSGPTSCALGADSELRGALLCRLRSSGSAPVSRLRYAFGHAVSRKFCLSTTALWRRSVNTDHARHQPMRRSRSPVIVGGCVLAAPSHQLRP